MSVNAEFDDWAKLRPVLAGYSRCSPNLRAVMDGVARRWSVESLGCFGRRPVRGSTTIPSVHTWGAAMDMAYGPAGTDTTRPQLIGYLVAWSEELHVQAIHDYVGCRIWRAGRTPDPAEACTRWWRAQRPDAYGMGSAWATWLHVETTVAGWDDEREESDRGIT